MSIATKEQHYGQRSRNMDLFSLRVCVESKEGVIVVLDSVSPPREIRRQITMDGYTHKKAPQPCPLWYQQHSPK
jgi:hypothetical protein